MRGRQRNGDQRLGVGGIVRGIGNTGERGCEPFRGGNPPHSGLAEFLRLLERLLKQLPMEVLQLRRAGPEEAIVKDVDGTVPLPHRKEDLRKDHVTRNLIGEMDQPLPADLHCLLEGAIGKKPLRFVREHRRRTGRSGSAA
ncbi:MAG: hypothetical protein UZ07_CHB004000469 [Chlorobi bacterium OLB7]|nr:MAG: hypothetical protein UZ07_CHB004000469 [Chlorobi bacterium OLB7]